MGALKDKFTGLQLEIIELLNLPEDLEFEHVWDAIHNETLDLAELSQFQHLARQLRTEET